MRLRLSVQRNSLPPVNVLWSVPETSSSLAYTIARLLEDVNNIIPLEAEHWGLEDYVVEVQGFECLHFSSVAQALKEDDLVSIRPLLTAEVRARTLTGRVQINEGGQHIVDGVPFGRPYLRKPHRPAVRIPPCKRQRLNEDTWAGSDEVNSLGLITANGEVSLEEGDSGAMSNSVTSPAQQNKPQQKKSSKAVQFKNPVVEHDDDSSEDSDDDDFVLDEDIPGIDVSMTEDSDDSSDDSSDNSSDDSSDDSYDDSDSDSESSSDTDSSRDSSGSPESHKIQRSVPSTLPGSEPGKGTKKTRNRNHRRRDAEQLRLLKTLELLPRNASLDDMKSWRDANPATREQQIAEARERVADPLLPKKRKRGATKPISEIVTTSEASAELEQRRQELMARMGDADALPSPQPTPTPAEHVQIPPELAPTSSEPPRKRLRPDTSVISRILARQTQPLIKKVIQSTTASEDAHIDPESIDPDLWKSKINLSAFECWEEDFELSTPPFPFQQHWDAASNLRRQKINEERQNQKKKKKRKPSPYDSFANEESAEAMELDYGDAPEADKVEVDTETAAVESQLLQDVEVAAKSDLPFLPEDVGSLPALTQSDMKAGAIIVFKMFEMTRGAPEISRFKTAVVEDEGDSGNGAGVIGIRLAERDREKTEHKLDKKGNRIYDKADNFWLANDGEDEEDDGRRDLDFMELLEGRLLQGAVSIV